MFDEMCRERGIHPAFGVAYAARGTDGVRDLGLALWAASADRGGSVTAFRSDRIDLPFEVKSLEEKRLSDGSTVGSFSGLASVFNNTHRVKGSAYPILILYNQ